MELFTSRDFCLHHMTESDALYKQIWLLCLLNVSLNSLWSYAIVNIT